MGESVGGTVRPTRYATDQSGGGRGIRTPGGVTPTVVFKTTAFNRSAIPPQEGQSIAIPGQASTSEGRAWDRDNRLCVLASNQDGFHLMPKSAIRC